MLWHTVSAITMLFLLHPVYHGLYLTSRRKKIEPKVHSEYIKLSIINYKCFRIKNWHCEATCCSPHILEKEFIEACGAVRFPTLLLEDALAQLPQTEGAHKVLRVKLVIESRDAAACDGLAAAAAQSALSGMEVHGAQRSAVQLHEAAVGEGLETVL